MPRMVTSPSLCMAATPTCARISRRAIDSWSSAASWPGWRPSGRWKSHEQGRSADPQHLEALNAAAHAQLHLIAFPAADQALSGRGPRADPPPLLTVQQQLQAGAGALGVGQPHQSAELNAQLCIEGPQPEFFPGAQGLANLLDPARLAGSQIGGLQAQGVVLVLGDILFVCGRLIGGQRRLLGLCQVAAQLVENKLLEQGFVQRSLAGSAGRISAYAPRASVALAAESGIVHGLLAKVRVKELT